MFLQSHKMHLQYLLKTSVIAHLLTGDLNLIRQKITKSFNFEFLQSFDKRIKVSKRGRNR